MAAKLATYAAVREEKGPAVGGRGPYMSWNANLAKKRVREEKERKEEKQI